MDLSKISGLKGDGEKQKTGGFTNQDRCVLKQGDNIVRLVGDFHWTYRTWIKCDDDKPRPFNLQEDSILFEVIKYVLSHDFVDDPTRPGKKMRQYKFEKTNPEIFQLVNNNGSPNSDDRGWYPSKIFMFNCIDRESNWCELNRHTRLLVKSKSEIGVGQTAFDAFATIAEEYGNPEKYDLNFSKKGNTRNNTKYGCLIPNQEKHNCVVKGDVSEKEQEYQLHDLQKLAAPTSASDVLNYLKNTIMKIDQEMGTSFHNALSKEAQDGVVSHKPATAQVEQKQPAEAAPSAPVENQFVQASDTNTCPECNKETPVDAKFCSNCGAKFDLE